MMNPDPDHPLWVDTDRRAGSPACLGGGAARGMYQRALSAWALDVLSATGPAVWNWPDALADFRNHDWQQLYAGSILDD